MSAADQGLWARALGTLGHLGAHPCQVAGRARCVGRLWQGRPPRLPWQPWAEPLRVLLLLPLLLVLLVLLVLLLLPLLLLVAATEPGQPLPQACGHLGMAPCRAADRARCGAPGPRRQAHQVAHRARPRLSSS